MTDTELGAALIAEQGHLVAHGSYCPPIGEIVPIYHAGVRIENCRMRVTAVSSLAASEAQARLAQRLDPEGRHEPSGLWSHRHFYCLVPVD
jgi:hypothetical protein